MPRKKKKGQNLNVYTWKGNCANNPFSNRYSHYCWYFIVPVANASASATSFSVVLSQDNDQYISCNS